MCNAFNAGEKLLRQDFFLLFIFYTVSARMCIFFLVVSALQHIQSYVRFALGVNRSRGAGEGEAWGRGGRMERRRIVE